MRVPKRNYGKKWDKCLYSLFFSAGLLWTIYLFVNSPGVTLHDEIGHFLIAQNAWNYPELLLSSWGRTLNTLFYFLPVLWGWSAARCFSVLAACLIVLFTTLVAREGGVRPLYLIPLFLWFQPWFHDTAFEVVTEIPFTLFLILAVYLVQREQWWLSALIFGGLPLIRHEGIAITGIFMLYAAWRGKWPSAWLSLLPLGIYNLVHWQILGDWPFAIYLEPKPTFIYGQGAWWHYFPRVAYKAGLPISLFCLFAVKPLWKEKEKLVIFIPFITYFLVHLFIFYFGLFASGGYSIFLLPIAPALAIMAAIGASKIRLMVSDKLNLPGMSWKETPRRLKTVFVVVMCLVIFNGLLTRPKQLDSDGQVMKAAAEWIHRQFPETGRVISTHVWFYYFFQTKWLPEQDWETVPDLDKLSTGSLVLWDIHYATRLGINPDRLSIDPHWKLIKIFGENEALLFQRL